MCGEWELRPKGEYPYTNTIVEGRWVICFNCHGYGKEYMQCGDTRFGTGSPCGWCDETGKRWEEKSHNKRKTP